MRPTIRWYVCCHDSLKSVDIEFLSSAVEGVWPKYKTLVTEDREILVTHDACHWPLHLAHELTRAAPEITIRYTHLSVTHLRAIELRKSPPSDPYLSVDLFLTLVWSFLLAAIVALHTSRRIYVNPSGKAFLPERSHFSSKHADQRPIALDEAQEWKHVISASRLKIPRVESVYKIHATRLWSMHRARIARPQIAGLLMNYRTPQAHRE